MGSDSFYFRPFFISQSKKKKKKALDNNTLTKTKQRPKGLALTLTDIRKNMIPPFQRICRFKTQRAFPIVQTTLKSNALSYTIFIVYMIYIYELKSKKFNF